MNSQKTNIVKQKIFLQTYLRHLSRLVVAGEPRQALVQAVPRGGACRLDIPVSVPQSGEPKLLLDLVRLHGWKVRSVALWNCKDATGLVMNYISRPAHPCIIASAANWKWFILTDGRMCELNPLCRQLNKTSNVNVLNVVSMFFVNCSSHERQQSSQIHLLAGLAC